jgi:DivIVA domain-containing protein
VPTLLLIVLVLASGGLAMFLFPQPIRGPGGPAGEALAEPNLPPPGEPVTAVDVAVVRFPLAFRGYRVADVDTVLDRLATELSDRDALIAELVASAARRSVTDRPHGRDDDAVGPAGGDEDDRAGPQSAERRPAGGAGPATRPE